MSAFYFLEHLMTIILQRPSQSYAARPNRPYTLNATIPEGFTLNALKISLTRESWPAGPIVEVLLTFPDGGTAGFSAAGGTILDRQGNVLQASSVTFERFANGQRNPFPAGDYTLSFTALQPITTALTIERF